MADAALHTLFVAPETLANWGTQATTGFKTARLTGCSLGLTKDSIISDELRGDRQIIDHQFGVLQAGGEISGEVTIGGVFDDFLAAALQGTWATNTLKAGTTRQPFTMIRKFADVAAPAAGDLFLPYTGVEINTLTINTVANGISTFSLGVIGKTQNVAVTVAPTGISTATAATTSGMMTGSLGTLNEGGATVALCTEASFTLENGMEVRPVIGQNFTLFPSNGRSLISGSASFYFENATLLNKFINGTSTSIEYTVRDEANKSFTFKLPRIKYTGGQPDVSGQGSIILTMPFQALRDPTDASNIVITRVP